MNVRFNRLYAQKDIARPLLMREEAFLRDRIVAALRQFGDGKPFHVHELAQALGLPQHWTYPACALCSRLKGDGAAENVRYAHWRLTRMPL